MDAALIKAQGLPRAGRSGTTGQRAGLFFIALVLAGTLGAAPVAAEASGSGKRPAPDFSLPDLKGTEIGLRDFRGRYLLVNFWATWCGPCKLEMPSLEILYRRFVSRRLAVVGISNDMFGATVVEPYVRDQELTFPILLDPQLEASNAFEVLSLPTTYLIDPEGNIIGVLSGAENWAAPETLRYFDDLLKEP